MAGVSETRTYDALLTTTLANYQSELEPQIFDEYPLLSWCNGKLAGAMPDAHVLISHRSDAAPTRVALSHPHMVIGRTGDNLLPVHSAMVSMRHAVIHFHDGAFWVADMGSTNGTLVNGVRIDAGEHRLRPGDVIQVGDVKLEYRPG